MNTTSLRAQEATQRTLSELDEEDRYAAYDRLQQSMPDVWAAMRRHYDDESVVVVPSISLAQTTTSRGTLTQAMEERALFQLLLLRQPRLRMVYVTSLPVAESIVDYYLGLLPGVIISHARARLTMISIGDAGPDPLSAKLLARPRLLREIRSLIPNPARCHLIPYNTTDLERDVALSLGIPMYGADPRLAGLGTKTGCRRMFTDLGIRCPVGADDLHSIDDLVDAIRGMRQRRPSLTEAIVKLNEGVSGSGNALVDLRNLPSAGSAGEPEAVRERVLNLALENPKTDIATYLAAFDAGGGIVEERITGVELTSPSVQMRAHTDGTVELLSTHDQLLGGPSGQRFLGCVFPADPGYAPSIAEQAMVVGRHLAQLGVIGRFAVDFVTVRDDDGNWTPYAIELNLRKGGTTHPFLTLQFLTDGTYDGARGIFETATGVPKYLVATDHLEDERLKALTVEDLFDIVARHGLHYDASQHSGVVLHMFSSLAEHGRLGLTAVGNTADEARRIYRTAETTLLDEADRALVEDAVVG
jgi:hypothetical protein